MKEHDLLILGGGPGGYVCAIRAAQLGINVAIVEKRSTLGGTCVNVGCIPSKALLDSSHKYKECQEDLKAHGIQVSKTTLDLKVMMQRKTSLVKELTDGLDFLMKKNKIHRYQGHASFVKTEDGKIIVQVDKKEEIQGKKCVIATGSQSIALPNVSIDGKAIISSDQAIALERVPKSLAIIGGGVIGLEMGSVWQRLGAQVTIIEALPSILMSLDKQMRDLATRMLKKQGIEFLVEHKVSEAKAKSGGVEIKVLDKNGKELKLEVDTLLVAVGRKPYIENLGIENVNVALDEKGRIAVHPETLETNVCNIYAIGDVISGPMLAHKAEEEGMALAERLAGEYGEVNYRAVPWIVYTWPEIAWVGKSEEELKKEGLPYNIGRAIFKSNGRAKAMNEAEGQIKILASQKDDRILGIFIVGPNASELIAEATLAVEFGASAEDLARSFHAHPTLAEVLREAALDVDKRAIHA